MNIHDSKTKSNIIYSVTLMFFYQLRAIFIYGGNR